MFTWTGEQSVTGNTHTHRGTHLGRQLTLRSFGLGNRRETSHALDEHANHAGWPQLTFPTEDLLVMRPERKPLHHHAA